MTAPIRDTGTQFAGLSDLERAAAMAEPHMSVCDAPTIEECLQCRGVLRVIRAVLAAALPAAEAKTLNSAYWKLREHASGYRSAEVFRRAMEAYEEDRSDPVKCRRAMNHEWYARGIEAAARTIAELLGVPEHELGDDDPVSRSLMEGLGDVRVRFWACPVRAHRNRNDARGWPVVTVEWEGDVARCTAERCGRTSADEREETS